MTSYRAADLSTHTAKSKRRAVLGVTGVALALGLTGCSNNNNDTAATAPNADGTPAATEGQNIIKLKIRMPISPSTSLMAALASKPCQLLMVYKRTWLP